VTASSSWLGLVKTIASGTGYYLGIVLALTVVFSGLFCVTIPFWFVLALLKGLKLSLAAYVLGCLFMCGSLVWFLWRRADYKIFDAKNWVDANERYGRTLERSLARALRKHAKLQEERRKARADAAAEPSESLAAAGPAAERG
jgi:hypothetical protein